MATPTKGKAAAHEPTTICLTLWRRVHCSNQRTTQLPGLHLESRLEKKKTTKNQPRQVHQNKYAGFRFKHILTTFGLIQKSESEPNKCISEGTARVCSIPNHLVPKGPGNVTTNNSEHRRTQAPTQDSQGALRSLEVDISSGLPSDRQHQRSKPTWF